MKVYVLKVDRDCSVYILVMKIIGHVIDCYKKGRENKRALLVFQITSERLL